MRLDAAQNEFVVDRLAARSTRPRTATRVWAELFLHLRLDTGEVLVSRRDLADAVGTHPNNISAVTAELERMRAIVRRRDGRHVRYFMNPLVGTGTGGAAGDEARAGAFPSRSIDGGKA